MSPIALHKYGLALLLGILVVDLSTSQPAGRSQDSEILEDLSKLLANQRDFYVLLTDIVNRTLSSRLDSNLELITTPASKPDHPRKPVASNVKIQPTVSSVTNSSEVERCSDVDSPEQCAYVKSIGMCASKAADNIVRQHCARTCGVCVDTPTVSAKPLPVVTDGTAELVRPVAVTRFVSEVDDRPTGKFLPSVNRGEQVSASPTPSSTPGEPTRSNIGTHSQEQPLPGPETSQFSEGCDVQLSKIGCYNDDMNNPRPLPELLLNSEAVRKNAIWGKKFQTLGMLPTLTCECATLARDKGFKVVGIQNGDECWSGRGGEFSYSQDGPAERDMCSSRRGTACDSTEFYCTGKRGANYIYTLGPMSGSV